MSILLDKDIREIFTVHHAKRYPRSILLSEVRVNNGLAIADLVSIGGKTSHCYEIKSDRDKISRVLEQSKSYEVVFKKISLITTYNLYKKALVTIPSYWGIVIVSNTPKNKVYYCRKASVSPYFSKQDALYTLWRDELLKILLMKNITEKSSGRASRSMLIDTLCGKLSNLETCKWVNYFLLNRQYNQRKTSWFK
ncbi:MAG: sce7726 family protein [Treponema sp.]|nr:sce7726 family protein [Treponema sp.]